jgi:hypothetical protein
MTWEKLADELKVDHRTRAKFKVQAEVFGWTVKKIRQIYEGPPGIDLPPVKLTSGPVEMSDETKAALADLFG